MKRVKQRAKSQTCVMPWKGGSVAARVAGVVRRGPIRGVDRVTESVRDVLKGLPTIDTIFGKQLSRGEVTQRLALKVLTSRMQKSPPTHAIQLFDQARNFGLRMDVMAQNTAIQAYATIGQVDRALQLREEMKREGLEGNYFTYRAAISACAMSGQGDRSDQAVHLLQEMRDEGLKRDTIIYNAALSACEKGAKPDEVLKLLQQMKREGVEWNTFTYSAVISACKKRAQIDQALQLLQEMKGKGVERNTITYSESISACIVADDFPSALEVLNAAQSDGVFKASLISEDGGFDLHWKNVLTEKGYSEYCTRNPEAVNQEPSVPLPIAKVILFKHLDQLTLGTRITIDHEGYSILFNGVFEFLDENGISTLTEEGNKGFLRVVA